MSFHEVITPRGHILYWLPKNHEQLNSTKILGMDLDWTLIRPVKGKIHPVDENDWQLLYNNLDSIKHKQADGYKFVIFTNQGGLLSKKGGQMGVDQFKTRWHHILDKLESKCGITDVYMLVSLHDDFNRKPSTGMWVFMEQKLNNDIKVKRTDCLYVGDMAGRKGDHSASDLLFALNLEVDFQVPEVFLDGDNTAKNKTKKLIKSVLEDESLFNSRQFLETFDKNISKSNKTVTDELCAILEDKACQSLVLFVGSPASGKSSYYHRYLEDVTALIYLSMDTFTGTPGKFMKQVEMHLSKGNNIIIDNTNGTKKAREKFITLARAIETVNKSSNKSSNKSIKCVKSKINIIVMYITTEKSICMHSNALRTKLNNAASLQDDNDKNDERIQHNVPAVALHTYWKNFQIPNTDDEDIDIIYKVDYDPVFITDTKEERGVTSRLTKEDFMMLM
jgi:bifunctional polynucleotide phosphatase/kinase